LDFGGALPCDDAFRPVCLAKNIDDFAGSRWVGRVCEQQFVEVVPDRKICGISRKSENSVVYPGDRAIDSSDAIRRVQLYIM
jgi:hypothetical protein